MVGKTVAVYGGSFNPPHIGHAMVIQWLLWTHKASEVLCVPSDGHPLGKTHGTPFEDRVQMLRLMCKDVDRDRMDVSDIEGRLPKPVYTYDLLTALRATHWGQMRKDWNWRFVIGADILQETHKWHMWDKVRDEYDLIVLGREGYPSPDGSPIIPDFSSSEIRRLLDAGDDRWKDMVTPQVRDFLGR